MAKVEPDDAMNRITIGADQAAYIRETGIPAVSIAAMVQQGMTTDEIIADLPNLEPQDIDQALRYGQGLTSADMKAGARWAATRNPGLFIDEDD